ncbi:hypothetical protein ZWY2020_040766 [Hordeum vulgare]|nr:hypothetical protein ZWY2020_040766 [Hordeum vulgare]
MLLLGMVILPPCPPRSGPLHGLVFSPASSYKSNTTRKIAKLVHQVQIQLKQAFLLQVKIMQTDDTTLLHSKVSSVCSQMSVNNSENVDPKKITTGTQMPRNASTLLKVEVEGDTPLIGLLLSVSLYD